MNSPRPKVVILNDTATRYHHGCARVMRLLCAGLERHGLKIHGRLPAHVDWTKDEASLQALREADLIVINGEGTLHHGKPAGAKLLEVTDHPVRGETPVALINALYQANPPEWDAALRRLTLITARDSQSADALAAGSGGSVRWLPDLSLTAPSELPARDRHGVIVGDSVKYDARRKLAQIAQRLPDVTFVPTKTLRQRIWRLPVVGTAARALLYRIYNGYGGWRTPVFDMPLTEQIYLERLSRTSLHITGRFHGVCLSMLTKTPFVAFHSNAPKIERLLSDAGLSPDRLITDPETEFDPARLAFTEAERTALDAFTAKAHAEAETLFGDLAQLARRSS